MSIGSVAFMSLNRCVRQRVRTLFIRMLFIARSARLYCQCATRTFALFSGVVILTWDLYAFELVHMDFI